MFYLPVHVNLIMLNFIYFIVCILQMYIGPNEMFLQIIQKQVCFYFRQMSLELTEDMSSRKRRPNWTDQECLFLAQLVQEKKNIIRGKCSTGVSTQDKRNAWEDIAQTINTTFPQIQRTVSDCNKKWENLLAKTREEMKRQKRLVGAGEKSCFLS